MLALKLRVIVEERTVAFVQTCSQEHQPCLVHVRLASKNNAATGSFCTRLLGELDCRGEKTSSPELVLLLQAQDRRSLSSDWLTCLSSDWLILKTSSWQKNFTAYVCMVASGSQRHPARAHVASHKQSTVYVTTQLDIHCVCIHYLSFHATSYPVSCAIGISS